MKAIILASGKGTRLRPLTYTTPKPMIKIVWKPILEHILEGIYKKVSEIVIVVKYLKEKIIEDIWENYKWVKISFVIQWEKKWTWAALLDIKFLKELEQNEEVLILNWDSIFDKKDLEKIISLKNFWALVLETKTPEKYWIYKQDENKFATKIIEKPKEFVWNLANLWVYKFSFEIFDLVKKIKLSSRWEYEITDAINLFLEKNKFKLVKIKWNFIDIWYVEDIKKAEKILKNNLYKKPKIWKIKILENFWDYKISLWIPKNQIKNLIKNSLDKDDIAIQKWTWDLKRFANEEKFEKWYNDENRFLFCLLDKKNILAWIRWGRPANFPHINNIIDEKNYNKVLENKKNIHTNWIRIYKDYRWKWLSKILFNCEKHYEQIFENIFNCIDIEKENMASIKAYEKQWYKYFATWKNDNESMWTSSDRMILVKICEK